MDNNSVNARRRSLLIAVSSLMVELGFDAIDKDALETLIEMTQAFLSEIGSSSRSYCELAGRTEPVIGDVILALVNMGIRLDGLEAHARRINRSVLPTPSQSTQPKQLNILQAGVKQPHLSHIPSHLPLFPDPHAYIRTPTHKQPVTEYEAIREKAATQKRDLERALTRFIAKTGDTHSYFLTEDSNMFPLIACKPHHPPYLKALLPQDQIFDFEDEFLTSPQRGKKNRETEEVEEEGDGKEAEDGVKNEADMIDNPYLRPVKLPWKKKPR